MNSLRKKIKRSIRYYYYGKKNGWTFPPNIAHSSGGKMACGSYEPGVSEKLTESLKKGTIFIDIGANVGYFSRLASEIVGREGVVYAFEVDLENYYALLNNVNGYSNIHALHFAISNDNSFVEVNHSSHSACHSMVNTDNLLDGMQFSVPSMTLDHFWKTYLHKIPVDLIKIDVEGAELMVLNGMQTLLSENMVHAMIIEFCPAILKKAGFKIADFYQKIASNFSISIIDEEYRMMSKDGTIDSYSELKAVSNQLTEKDEVININLCCNRK